MRSILDTFREKKTTNNRTTNNRTTNNNKRSQVVDQTTQFHDHCKSFFHCQ